MIVDYYPELNKAFEALALEVAQFAAQRRALIGRLMREVMLAYKGQVDPTYAKPLIEAKLALQVSFLYATSQGITFPQLLTLEATMDVMNFIREGREFLQAVGDVRDAVKAARDPQSPGGRKGTPEEQAQILGLFAVAVKELSDLLKLGIGKEVEALIKKEMA